jgi:hypothetical protein
MKLVFRFNFSSLLLRSVTLICILTTNYEYDANISSFFRLCYDDCVQAEAVFTWRLDAGALEAGRGQSRRKTRASWRPDAGALEAGRGQSGRKTWASWRPDAGGLFSKLVNSVV